MAEFRLNAKWMASASGAPEVRATAALFDMYVDGIYLTRNQDIWAETVRDNVFVSAYPLAMWFAASWWRLNYEPLPAQQPGHDWRMAHELGAANHGFVWPRVIFVPDGEAIHLWAAASMTPDQSVQYLQSLDVPRLLPLGDFQQGVQRFMQSVLARLDAKALAASNLAQLWAVLQEDLADPEAVRRRKLEAELGFDPEECPEDALDAALLWEERVGEEALTELAPAIASSGGSPDLTTLEQLEGGSGVVGTPTVSPDCIVHLDRGAPWERAVHDAQALRRAMGNIGEPLSSRKLYDLLGLPLAPHSQLTEFAGRARVAVAIPLGHQQMKFVPRRRNPVGQRFQLARFLGEYLRSPKDPKGWLASTDLATSRQKYQRAFAAEFLCPIESLTSFLDGDFSSYAIDEAVEKFEVSEKVVTNLLLNSGYIPHHRSSDLPYRVAA